MHSNMEALEAVIADAEAAGGFERVLCLGDIVGYGPDPGVCLALLRSYPHAAVAGNHDLAAIGDLSVETFNPAARTAALWTRQRLTAGRAGTTCARTRCATKKRRPRWSTARRGSPCGSISSRG